MKKTEAYVITVLFCLLITVPLALTLLSPKREFSEWENRNLATLPEVSSKSVFSGEFGQGFETYLTDHFVFRDFWVKTKRELDASLLIRESNGIIIGEKGLFDIPEVPDQKAIDNNISAINSFVSQNALPASLVLVPSSAEVFPEALPAIAPRTQESDVISDIYSRLSGVRTIDAIAPLSTLDYAEAYYTTDHHWTTKGAAKVYESFIGEERNFEFETVATGFLGTLTSRSGDTSLEGDRVEKIVTGDLFTMECDGEVRDSMYFDEYLSRKDKYSYFLGTNKALVTLESKTKNGRTLLIFKDSYAHSFVQCAAEDFEKVILVDLRYVSRPVSSLIDMSEVDDVLFLYSTETFTTLDNMVWLGM